MKKLISLCLLTAISSTAISQQVFTLDSCRNMALNNNKQIRIAEEKIKAAGGISSFDDAEKFISLGASRLGTSRLIKIMKNTDNGAGY